MDVYELRNRYSRDGLRGDRCIVDVGMFLAFFEPRAGVP